MISTMNLYRYEEELYLKNIKYVCGVDEVGRGPLAGPLVVAACILPKGLKIDGINDSKKLSEKKREELYVIIKEKAISYAVVFKTPKEVDKLNIYQATEIAMKEAVLALDVKPEHVLIDAMPLNNWDFPHTSIIHGDELSASIAAASILAKVTRDHYMIELDKEFPMYDFKKNKGYGTKKHMQAIEKYGITKYHRMSYSPVYNASKNYHQISLFEEEQK